MSEPSRSESEAERVWARGIVTACSYDDNGALTNTVYSDSTPSVSLVYNRAGRQIEARDAAGVTIFAYDDFGAVTNETVIGVAGTNVIERFYDAFGRSLGYALNGIRQSTLAYDPATGRLVTMEVPVSDGSNNNSPTPNSNFFTWNYLPGSDLKSSLAYPNGLTSSWQYDANNQLLQVCNATPTNTISQYDYVYDAAGRRVQIARSGSAMSETRTDIYGYNARGELVSASKTVGRDDPSAPQPVPATVEYVYQYDDIGNRETSSERGTNSVYAANNLNQYITISNFVSSVSFVANEFAPQFDDDGNQTLIQTATGIGQVTYNGENRPVYWSNGTTNITMPFDRMGRRIEYVEAVDTDVATITNAHHRFVYDGYLCIQRLNAAANNAIDLIFAWDPAEPVATRPLMIEKPGKCMLHVTHDGNKNVSDLVFFSGGSGVAAHYEYAPFGALAASTRNSTSTAYNFRIYNPFRFSSEYADDTLGLMYYNYRHYEPVMGRWLSRDPIEERGGANVYAACQNQLVSQEDMLGFIIHPQFGFDTTPIRIPPFPTPLDQIRGVKPHGEEAWFEKNYPGWLAEARRRFTAEIEAAVDCKTTSFEGPSERISIRPSDDRGGWPFYRTPGGNEQEYGDEGQSDFSADKILGSFSIDYVTPVEIKYTDIGGGKRRYEWSTEMYIEDVLGLQDHDRLAQIWVLGGLCEWLLPSRRVKRARWTLSGSGECDCEERR